jgi:hypothetical protein
VAFGGGTDGSGEDIRVSVLECDPMKRTNFTTEAFRAIKS